MKALLFFLVACAGYPCFAQDATDTPTVIRQITFAENSPNVSNVTGNVTIIYSACFAGYVLQGTEPQGQVGRELGESLFSASSAARLDDPGTKGLVASTLFLGLQGLSGSVTGQPSFNSVLATSASLSTGTPSPFSEVANQQLLGSGLNTGSQLGALSAANLVASLSTGTPSPFSEVANQQLLGSGLNTGSQLGALSAANLVASLSTGTPSPFSEVANQQLLSSGLNTGSQLGALSAANLVASLSTGTPSPFSEDQEAVGTGLGATFTGSSTGAEGLNSSPEGFSFSSVGGTDLGSLSKAVSGLTEAGRGIVAWEIIYREAKTQ
jgi:hypothetical protein